MVIMQYIIMRGDLRWPMGALIAQGCHATAAVLHEFSSDTDTMEYLKNVKEMHKVVLKCKDEQELVTLNEALRKDDIKHVMWIEQPEGTPTCIAIKPYVKETVQNYVKHLKLFK